MNPIHAQLWADAKDLGENPTGSRPTGAPNGGRVSGSNQRFSTDISYISTRSSTISAGPRDALWP